MPDRSGPTSPRIAIDPAQPQPRSNVTSPNNPLTPSRTAPAGSITIPHRSSMSGRSYRPDDPDARERQTQQDIESASAMSMSRARSGSINHPDNSPPMARPSQMHFPSTSPIHEGRFPMLSEAEEAEMDRARRLHGGRDNESDDEHGHGGHYHRHVEERAEEDHGRRDSIGDGSGYDSHSRLLNRRGSDGDIHHMDRARHLDLSQLGGHGMRNTFDFAAMEEFANKEKENSFAAEGAWGAGNDGPRRRSVPHTGAGASDENLTQPGSYDTALDRTNTMSAFGDEPDIAFSPERGHHDNHAPTFQRRRQRKLSQSNPVLRQKKLALFEGFGSNGVNDGESVPEGASTAFKAPRQKTGSFAPYSDSAPGHDRPYRFSFYSNAMPVTIHARSLAELPAEGQSFEDLFKGRNLSGQATPAANLDTGARAVLSETPSKTPAPPVEPSTAASGKTQPSLLTKAVGAAMAQQGTGGPGPGVEDDDPEQSTWWLDVLSPTDEEMRLLSKAFGIHPLTTEDILLEETREKIELFRNYYLVCFRSFDQDPYSQTYLEPLNMYIIVFREGTLSFHFRGTPHPQNVRRRIKHLKDYISVTSDWISYALIDDITDAFGPLIQGIEFEVDSIDELVLILKEAEQSDMLRRIGTCRKKVMGLLRLMGNKADVVKGLAKRCNEQWLVAPKSDIGLYLSDIQDHLITMTQNLNHYEKILSRSHSNYLAQISIEMTDANNQINDVLSKLTALGTVLIPMNLVTGLWGMNVHVPGQDIETGYSWFGGILGCLCLFAILGAWATYKCFVVR
ncbi:hypothetical protein, variant 1 [Cryptococcus amylolentus CBS 6039]|uniref:Uncharacterized protein n=2 Tax=Cryptococcus amylolentus CBS 6039 TaxID=1295533 RepID=A0A1E3I4J4_9TREE|nr:hypothetical protein, variant 1 [Cryptococcus amylolentus CBS 6039]ODN83590.1 hypothetical protein, variant 1 [Cryptococcus amylolentus CBS 6039]